jgi:hypothetical protein
MDTILIQSSKVGDFNEQNRNLSQLQPLWKSKHSSIWLSIIANLLVSIRVAAILEWLALGLGRVL